MSKLGVKSAKADGKEMERMQKSSSHRILQNKSFRVQYSPIPNEGKLDQSSKEASKDLEF